jgi:hypothetical protein
VADDEYMLNLWIVVISPVDLGNYTL